MKKILTTLLLVLSVSVMALAVPAYPGKYQFTQPDGSVITLQNHGDEYFSWTTDESGRVVEMGEDGFYRPVDQAVHQARVRKARQASISRRGSWSSYEDPFETNFGDRKILCILAEFSDITFTIDDPKTKFTAMLNQSGYSYDGAIGSVRDYYIDNSGGQYRPEFDVYGPVTLSKTSAEYYQKGSYNKVPEAIMEAYELLEAEIDIDQYDTDSDGDVDMVLFYFAGHNQAEGAGTNTIWPHQGTGSYGTLGGKTFNRYFCTSELRGNSGTNMCAIGTTCHEFAHSLGLPDFYDTDYASNGDNSFTTGKFDLMAAGNYNDSGRRPPYMSAVERNMLGWMAAPTDLTDGEHVLNPIRNDVAYRSDSANPGEYYVLEVRDNYKWDSALMDWGLLIYHVDKSSRIVTGSTSAATLWEYSNSINAFGGHPCFYLKAASGSNYAFPGINSVTSLPLIDWDGAANGVILSGISFDGSKVSFRSGTTDKRVMYGYVTNTSGFPLSGARVVLSQSAHPFSAAPLLSGDRYVETDASGYYEFIIPDSASEDQILTVSKSGYTPVSLNVPIDAGFLRQDFYLPYPNEGAHGNLYRYDSALTFYTTRTNSTSKGLVFRYTASDLEAEGVVGHRIEAISFQACPTTYDRIYVLIDIDGERVLLRDVTDRFVTGGMTSVAVGDAGIMVPTGKDIYIGFGMTGLSTTEYNVNMYGPQDVSTNGAYYNNDFLNTTTWNSVTFGGKPFSFIISAEVIAPAAVTFSKLGVASIEVVADVPTVVAPSGKTLYATQWYLDGAPVLTPSAITDLSAGDHTYMVRLSYYDGTSERVYYDVHK